MQIRDIFTKRLKGFCGDHFKRVENLVIGIIEVVDGCMKVLREGHMNRKRQRWRERDVDEWNTLV